MQPEKQDAQIRDLVPVQIKQAKGITLRGDIVSIQKMDAVK